MTTAYVLNSPYSNDSIDVESTNWACLGTHNGVYTVCFYYDNLPPNTYVAFPIQSLGDNGLHVQASPDSNPTGSYDLQSCVITMNTATGSISIAPWGGPAEALKEGAEPPRKVELKKPAAQKRRPRAHEAARS